MIFKFTDIKKQIENQISNSMSNVLEEDLLHKKLTNFIEPSIEGFINAAYNNYYGFYKNIYHRFSIPSYFFRDVVRFNTNQFHIGRLVSLKIDKDKDYYICTPIFKKNGKYGFYNIICKNGICRFDKNRFFEIDIKKEILGIIVGNQITGYRGFPVNETKLLVPLIVIPIYPGDIFAIPYTSSIIEIKDLGSIGVDLDINEDGKYVVVDRGLFKVLFFNNLVVWVLYKDIFEYEKE